MPPWLLVSYFGNSTHIGGRSTDDTSPAAYANFPKDARISQGDFEALLGRPVPPNLQPGKGSYTINTPIGDMSDSFVGRQLFSQMQKQVAEVIEGQEGTPTALLMEAMVREMPMRSMLMLGDGSITREMLDALLVLINGRSIKGLTSLVGAFWKRGRG